MAGIPFPSFTEVYRITGPVLMTGKEFIVNDAQKLNYPTESILAMGRGKELFRGGTQIVDEVKLSLVRKARALKAYAAQNYQNPQTGTQIQIPWRSFITDITWDIFEPAINEGAAREGDRSLQYKSIMFSKEMETYADWTDFREEQRWAVADQSRMETAGGDQMFSVNSLINEFPNGLPTGASWPGGAWTTKAGINPALAGQTNWAAQRFFYGDVNVPPSTALTATSLLTQMQLATMRLSFQPPPDYQQYFEGSSGPLDAIMCTTNAKNFLWQKYLSSQNRWSDQWDPASGMPGFGGIRVVNVAALDGALIYPTASAANAPGTEGNATNVANFGAGPRFYFLKARMMTPFYHSMFTMTKVSDQPGGVMEDRKQPTVRTIPLVTMMNLFPNSLIRHGIVAPVAAFGVSGYPTN